MVGVIMPYLTAPRTCSSLEEYDASFVGLTATACLLGLGDAKADGIIDDRIVDAEMMMPAYLEPRQGAIGTNSRVRCIASCSVAYQQSRMSEAAQAAGAKEGQSAPELIRGHRLGTFPEQLRQAIKGWDEAVDGVVLDLSTCRPLFFDRDVETPGPLSEMETGRGGVGTSVAGKREGVDPLLMRDSNGMAYHLESLNANLDLTPTIDPDLPAFNSDQILAFTRRAEALRSSVRSRHAEETVKKVKALVEPLKLVAEIDPVAGEQLLQYEMMRRRHDVRFALTGGQDLDRRTQQMLERAPLTIGTIGSPVGWSPSWQAALDRSLSIDPSSPTAQISPSLWDSLEELLDLVGSSSAAGCSGARSDLSGTVCLDSPVFEVQTGHSTAIQPPLMHAACPPEILQAPASWVDLGAELHKPAPVSAASISSPQTLVGIEFDEAEMSGQSSEGPSSESESPKASGTVSAFKPSPKRQHAPSSEAGRGGRKFSGARTLSYSSNDS